MNEIFSAIDTDPHPLFNVSGRDVLAEPNDELSNLLDINDILSVVSVWVDYLCASRNLKGLFLLHDLLVLGQIPLARLSKAGI